MRATTRPNPGRGPLTGSALTFLFCTVAWVANAPPVRGQEPPAAAKADASLDRRRLLTLVDGSIQRLRSRRIDGQWQVRDGRDWVVLELEVVRHRLLSDSLGEAEALRRGVGRDDHARRAELARWMASQGLFPEAVTELDRVLRTEPEHAGALRVLREARIPLELSDAARADPAVALSETLIAGAGGSPALTEVAVQRLAEFSARVDLRLVLEVELGRPQNLRRAFAARALRRLFPGHARKELTHRALLDGWSDVRREAAQALRAAEDLAVALPAIEALGHQHSGVRANAAETLGHMGLEAAVEPLVGHLLRRTGLAGGGAPSGTRSNLFAGLQTAYVMDYEVEIAQGASIADPVVNVQASGVVFDVRTTVQLTEVIELRRTMSALRKLTGQDLRNDPQRWATWWEQNADQWRSLDRARAYEQRKLAGARALSQD